MPTPTSQDLRGTAIGRNVLAAKPRTWLVTGAAGFIGSHLVENLLLLEQKVVGFDNLSSGRHRLDEVRANVGVRAWRNFKFVRGDIRTKKSVQACCRNVDVVLHHAALVGVPSSFRRPRLVRDVNVTGFRNVLSAAVAAGVPRIIYASSSAVYGDAPRLPKRESMPTAPISPYGLSKVTNEIDAQTFSAIADTACIGFRYFNVFGERQDSIGQSGSVISRWIAALSNGQPPIIYGDGSSTRDFCHVTDVVRANLLAATTMSDAALNEIYNIGSGHSTTVGELASLVRGAITPYCVAAVNLEPRYLDERPGEIRHSRAATSKARQLLDYHPIETLSWGIKRTCAWFVAR